MAKDFSAAINEIMPLVKDGDTSAPFIITRDSAYGDWQVCYPYPAEKAGDFFISQREHDPFAVMYRGAAFAGGSFPYVHDKVLCDRLRVEYYEYCDGDRLSESEKTKLRALINFFEDNAGELSSKTTDYLAALDTPFDALTGMCPFNMATEHDGWTFNEDLAGDAIDHIERAVENRLRGKTDMIDATKEPGVFEYGGYHFKPVRQFRKGEAYRKLKGDSRGKADMQFAMRNMKDDLNLRIDWTGYTHEKFYAVSGSDADIFQCVENGKLYVPCSGKLFMYSEPPQKERPAGEKTSLLGRLDGAKAEAARQNAERADKPAPNQKRGDMEVD